ncbi:serine/threonine protein phosphatase [Streptomyces cinnamoneus]|uniref:Serine/threonine protein phosphatase n=1 Tax=Streptomyces cinnamoneus TaxID=53446 RepID=A0A2G1XKH4_STRCJ|nr:PP2C family protein-serine/threonine phosphatase [Streptomyces cinnamoneus]PHQ51738.1 serine/threonine protein phosphatase [Streptomyces cinnamoneus]PPT11986.1 serine/threonine-protein phosphatase [Streptomyces cinnamoneus]
MKRDPGPGAPPGTPPLPRAARSLVVAAYALLGVAVVTDLATNPTLTFSPVLATTPVLASIGTRRARVPLLAGLLALAIVAPLALADPDVALPVHLTAGATVLAITCVSTANVILVATRERELLQSRSVAEAAQRTLLRPLSERINGFRVAVRYQAAAAEARVGGDLYEVLATPFGVRLLMGDVRGKGLSAIETASDVLGTFREAAQVESDLTAVARRLDATVARRRVREEFVTAVVVAMPGAGDAGELVNCGHLPPLLRRRGEVTELESPVPDPPLALRCLVGGPYHRRRFSFAPGDQLVLYTDGVTEARDASGRFYPLAERLAGMPDLAPDPLAARIVADLRAYTGGGLADDAALLVVRRER